MLSGLLVLYVAGGKACCRRFVVVLSLYLLEVLLFNQSPLYPLSQVLTILVHLLLCLLAREQLVGHNVFIIQNRLHKCKKHKNVKTKMYKYAIL